MWRGRADTQVMQRPARRYFSLGVAAAMTLTSIATTVAIVAVPPATPAQAAGTPWTTPTSPPKCSQATINSGDVAGCVIQATSTLPENYGWPTPPFPDPAAGETIPWVNVAKGASGSIVSQIQAALNANGATLVVDGQFGSLTEAAVKAFQTANSLPSTGIVDEATADLLGVHNATSVWPPPGWNWLGWGYNGSPALADWEALFSTNPETVGSVTKGQFKTMWQVMPLFMGFLKEIQQNGYVLHGGAGAYVFRCTASTRKDCQGLTRSSLSLHSYGLASDFNTVQNPMKTYYGINGASACATPMQTDMPQWVIQTAEKWGLYWGGYAWSSGCASPAQYRSSVTRDPMHFEFNGSPAQAQAILLHNVGSGACFQVASETGTITDECLPANGVPDADTRIVIDTGAPAVATAALVNITATLATSNGYLTAESCGPASGVRQWSNGNPRPGVATASLAVVPLDTSGRFCLYQSMSAHTIVDVQGFFFPSAAAPDGALFTPITPIRSVDTRTQAYCGPDGNCVGVGPVPGGTEVLSVSASPVDAVASLANLTVVGPAGSGYVTADACATLTPGPQTRSNLNFAVGDTVANLAVVPSATDDLGVQFCTYSPTALQQIVDVQGYFTPAADGGLGFTALTPTRLVDTRQCWTDPVTDVERCNLRNDGGTIMRVEAPEGAAAVMVNLTAVQAQARGYVTAGRCSDLAPGPQNSSNVNAVVGSAVANTAVVEVDSDGTFCLYSSTTMHLVVDLIGTFSGGGDLRFQPVTPVRVHDTRLPA